MAFTTALLPGRHVKADLSRLSATARKAAQNGDWATVSACAEQLLKQDRKSSEGYFLSGLAARAAKRAKKAKDAFQKAIKLDAGRYDAAIELAAQFANLLRHADSLELLRQYESRLNNSPVYLDMAAGIYSRLGLHAKAWPLYRKANELQPGIDRFQANLAACAVYLGKIGEAKRIYKALLKRYPHHQRNHYELSRLERATDSSHVEQMVEVLETTRLPAEKNIFLYYGLGKELEDLERWEEAFHYFKLAGDAAASVANYDVSADIELVDRIIEVCGPDWLAAGTERKFPSRRTPIFIVGLPRTGTTLTERIVSSHSKVESADETFFMRLALMNAGGVSGRENMNPAVIEKAAKKDPGKIAKNYLDAVEHRLGNAPMFIDKLPENFLYLGFIARAFPDARLIHLRRNPMDTCYAMYKQSFFRYAYTLDDLGRYYVAHERLRRHWMAVLGGRLVEVEYESLVADQENQTRILLDKLGLEFEEACLRFERNEAASATASAVQVREKVHNRSVGRWLRFERQLEPLSEYLQSAGIDIE